MSRNLEVSDADRRLAREINAEVLRDSASPFAGKFVAIADGRVVATEDSFELAIAAWEQTSVGGEGGLVFEAGVDYEEPQEIWTA